MTSGQAFTDGMILPDREAKHAALSAVASRSRLPVPVIAVGRIQSVDR